MAIDTPSSADAAAGLRPDPPRPPSQKRPPSPSGVRDTPAMRQYFAFKKQHPDCLLLFRMGDFYECFDDDAVAAHKALGITLTERTPGLPMAGVPYHAVENYLRRLIDQGFRVAVAEQLEDPAQAKGVVDRGVTRVLTPGALVDESLLRDDQSNNLACVCFLDSGEAPDARVALAIVELSTGAFTLVDTTAHAAPDELARRSVSELLFAETADAKTPPRIQRIVDTLRLPATPRPTWHFRRAEAIEAIREQYSVATLAGFGLSDDDDSLAAAGAILRYLRETQDLAQDPRTQPGAPRTPGANQGAQPTTPRRRALAHLQPPLRESPSDYLLLDAAGLRALEIERTIRAPGASGGAVTTSVRANGVPAQLSGTDGSLLALFMRTGAAGSPGGRGSGGAGSGGGGSGGRLTSMGKRLLRDWLCRPLAARSAIEARQACVATLVEDRRTAAALAAALKEIQDVARIAGRLGLGRATPRDVVALGRSLEESKNLDSALQNAPAYTSRAADLRALCAQTLPLAEEILRSCIPNAPHHTRDGGIFQDGVDSDLDCARLLQRDAATWLAEYQKTLIERHDLPGIKVGYNRVFGYYIELTRTQARQAPAEFSRKQTLKNAERYITPELKDFEEKVTTAEKRAIEREQALFADLCARLAAVAPQIGAFGRIVAELDVLCCFAEIAARRGWVRPEIVDEPALDIRQGRHPVLEDSLGSNFVPNDTLLGTSEEPARLALITGPNMAGKSTYIRQTALLALLAHTGSFVPAERATIGLVDRIFTRIGADDAIHAGQSTFMVEMTETANILHHATARSLVILDEIGRGTSTLDGLSLAWAIAESLAGSDEGEDAVDAVDAAVKPERKRSRCGPRTLFATHYHELTELAERMPGRVRNLHVSVREWGEEIVFLHRILPGKTDRSYGIHVAKLAGMPRGVVERAKELLERLSVAEESMEMQAPAGPGLKPGAPRGGRADSSRAPNERASEQRPSGRRSAASRAETLKHADSPARISGEAPAARQMALFTEFVPHPVVEELKGLDLDKITPMEAFDALRKMRRTLEK